MLKTADGSEIILVPPKTKIPDVFKCVLEIDNIDPKGGTVDLTGGVWKRHPAQVLSPKSLHYEEETKSVVESWQGSFAFAQEDPQRGVVGLRPPQIGAVHALHARWSTSEEVSTIVMPTGTGKTEVMLSALVSSGHLSGSMQRSGRPSVVTRQSVPPRQNLLVGYP